MLATIARIASKKYARNRSAGRTSNDDGDENQPQEPWSTSGENWFDLTSRNDGDDEDGDDDGTDSDDDDHRSKHKHDDDDTRSNSSKPGCNAFGLPNSDVQARMAIPEEKDSDDDDEDDGDQIVDDAAASSAFAAGSQTPKSADTKKTDVNKKRTSVFTLPKPKAGTLVRNRFAKQPQQHPSNQTTAKTAGDKPQVFGISTSSESEVSAPPVKKHCTKDQENAMYAMIRKLQEENAANAQALEKERSSSAIN